MSSFLHLYKRSGEYSHPVTPVTVLYVLLGGVLAGMTAVTGLCDPDTWWVIADGNRILAGDFSPVNAYSHAFGSHQWNQIEWLSSVVIAIFAKLVGLDNLTLLQVIISLAIAAVVADMTRRESGEMSPLVFFSLFVCMLVSLRIRLTARAELFSLLFSAVLLNLWLRRVPKFTLLSGLLGVLWGNMHPGVIYGLGMICIFAVSSFLAGDKSASKQGVFGALAFFAGSLCNPFGFLNYWHVIDTLLFVQTQKLKIAEMNAPVLWQHPTFIISMILAALCVIPALVRRHFLFLLLFLLFFPLAFKVKRFVPYPVMLLLPFTHSYVKEAIAYLVKKWDWRPTTYAIPAALLTFCVWAAVAELKIWWPVQPFEWKVNYRFLPSGAADFIDRYNPPGNMFNDFNHGGYLAWRFYPQRRIFIDGRVPAYTTEVMNEYIHASVGPPGALNELLNKYSMDVAIVDRADRIYDHGAFERKFHMLGWELVYIEGAAFVYVRPGSAAAKAVTAPRFRALKPLASPEELHVTAQSSPAVLIGELSRIDPHRLLTRYDFQAYGSAAYSAHRPDLAYSFLAAGMQRFPADIDLMYGCAVTLKDLGRYREARNLLSVVIKDARNPDKTDNARRMLQQIPSEDNSHL